MLKDYSLVGAIATDEKEFVLMIRCVLMFRKIASYAMTATTENLAGTLEI
jgi:hypothetical protein